MTILLVFLLTFSSGRTWAAKTPSPPELIPHATENAASFSFRGLEDDHGGFYLVWPHVEGNRMSLLAQHVDAQGKALWTEPGIPLAADLPIGSGWDVTYDGQGGIHLAWEKGTELFAQRFGPRTGLPSYLEPLTVSTTTRRAPTLAPDGAGGAYVMWQERYLQERWVLMAQHVNFRGVKLWPKGGIRVSRRPSEQRNPRVVFDGSAGIVVAWQDFRESASQLQVQRLDYQGTRLWGEEGLVVTAPAGDPAKPPYVGAVGKGSAVLAWQASSSAADQIFLQYVDSSGKFTWGPQGKSLSMGTWNQWNPVLHGDGEGGTWIGWEDARASGQWHVFVQHFLSSGEPAWQGGGVALTSVSADQGRLAVAEDTQGGLFSAWVDNRLGMVGIYLQRVNSQGQTLLGQDGFTVVDRLINPQTPQVVGLTPQKAVIFWADTPSKGHWSLFWKAVETPAAGQK